MRGLQPSGTTCVCCLPGSVVGLQVGCGGVRLSVRACVLPVKSDASCRTCVRWRRSLAMPMRH